MLCGAGGDPKGDVMRSEGADKRSEREASQRKDRGHEMRWRRGEDRANAPDKVCG
jgi:hypothetical protein